MLLLSVPACGDSGGWTGVVTDSAGVTVVMNTDVGMWKPAEAWTAEVEMRLGSLEADPTYQFGQIGSIAVGSDGSIYVTDTQEHHIKVFTKEGKYLRTIGRPGGGPGELGNNARFLAVSNGDTLIVPDPTHRRINRYAQDGTALPDAPLRLEEGRPLRYNVSPSGVFVAQVRLPAPDTYDHLVVIEPSGLFGDTLMTFPSGGAARVPGQTYQFSPEPMWNVTDSLTVIMGVNNEYRIGMYDRSGTLKRILAKEYSPVPVTDRDLRAFLAYMDRAWLDLGVVPSRLPELRGRTHFAEVYPAYLAIHVGYRGSVWVQRIQTPNGLSDEDLERYNFLEEFGSRALDVFDSMGRYLGIVELPPRFQPRLFRGDRIYGVWRDDLDVQYVMRLRIRENR